MRAATVRALEHELVENPVTDLGVNRFRPWLDLLTEEVDRRTQSELDPDGSGENPAPHRRPDVPEEIVDEPVPGPPEPGPVWGRSKLVLGCQFCPLQFLLTLRLRLFHGRLQR